MSLFSFSLACPPLHTKKVIMMTDFEMLSVMFMIVMLVFTVLSYKQSK